jgi:hypothetical protein
MAVVVADATTAARAGIAETVARAVKAAARVVVIGARAANAKAATMKAPRPSSPPRS